MAVGHGSEFGKSSGWEHRLTCWAFQRATAVVTVSQHTRRWMNAGGIRPRLGRVIHNGADPERFTLLPATEAQRVRASLGLGDARLLLTVGNVTERKGQDVVIRALPAILARVPNTHYLMAGLPTNREPLGRLARELGVADHVHFLGRVEAERLVSLLNCCDVFVMTSQHTAGGDFEGFGIAAVEAALCGKPAVVSAGSGLTEAIVEGQTGLAVEEGNEAAVAGAVAALLTDEARRQRMGQSARERALTEQTWERSVAEYDALLREVVTGAGLTEDVAGGMVRSSSP